MKILFLGTSSGWPLPRLGCHCPLCSSPDPKDKRWRSSILVNDSILIDCGIDFYHQLQRVRKTKLKAIFISHIHPDHYFGIWDVGHLMNSKPIIYSSSKNLKAIIKRINDLAMTLILRKAKSFQPGQTIKINGLQITPFLVDHTTASETYAFQLVDKKSFVYMPDFRAIPVDSRRFLRNADCAVFDGSNLLPAGPKRWGHLSIKESLPLAKKLKIKEVYYTHIGHGPRMKTHQELEVYLQKKAGKSFHITYDGLELQI